MTALQRKLANGLRWAVGRGVFREMTRNEMEQQRVHLYVCPSDESVSGVTDSQEHVLCTTLALADKQ